jgi:hypothetical protein
MAPSQDTHPLSPGTNTTGRLDLDFDYWGYGRTTTEYITVLLLSTHPVLGVSSSKPEAGTVSTGTLVGHSNHGIQTLGLLYQRSDERSRSTVLGGWMDA